MLKVDISSFSFADRLLGENIRLSVRSGESAGIAGPNGSGKTTLLRITSGLTPHIDRSPVVPTFVGSIDLFGSPIANNDTYQLAMEHLAVLNDDSDSAMLFNSVKDELRFDQAMRGARNKEIVKDLSKVCDLMSISHLLDRKANTLSSGEKQRVAIARCLMGNVRLLYMDEPSLLLDEKSVSGFLSAMTAFTSGGGGILLASHDRQLLDSVNAVVDLSPKEPQSSRVTPQCDRALSHLPTVNPVALIAENVRFVRESPSFTLGPLSLNAVPGSITWLKGPNGSGKSTLLRMLAGVSSIRSGRVTIDGGPINRNLKNRILIGTNPNYSAFRPTVDKELDQPNHRSENSRAYRDIKRYLFEQVFKEKVESETTPFKLSFGQRTFLSNLAALCDAPVVLLDEPFIGLDTTAQRVFIRTLNSLKTAGRTIIIASHNSSIMREISDFTYELTDNDSDRK